MHKDVTLVTVFDLFLDSLSASVEKLDAAANQGEKLVQTRMLCDKLTAS